MGFKEIPTDYDDPVFASEVADLYTLLRIYCSDCHRANAPVQVRSPYFSSDDPETAWQQVQSKINLANPADSRLVVRLRDEGHNCWDDCANDSQQILNLIAAIANAIPDAATVDPVLTISKAQVLLEHGITASGGGRYETDIIAKWEFAEGIDEESIAADTSGVQPEINLSLTGGESGYKLS